MARSATLLNGEVSVIINPAAVNAMANSPSGPVVRDLLVRGERVKLRARQLCPVRTGNLRDHILKRLSVLGGVTIVIVGVDGATVPYAYWVHEGRGPVTAKRAPYLVFMGNEGHLVSVKSVRATRPNRFLTNALPAAAG